MTSSILPASASRRTLADCLFRLIENPSSDMVAASAASLLRLFVEPEDIPRLEALLIRAPLRFRFGLLRAFEWMDWSLSDACFAQQLKDLRDVPDGRPGKRKNFLLNRLLCLDLTDEQVALAHQHLAAWPGERAGRFLVHPRCASAPWPPSLAARLYQQARDAGCLDVRLAWATFDQSASRALLLGGIEAVDLRKLRHAIHGWSPEALDELFDAHPARFEEALEALVLPRPYLERCVDQGRVDPGRLEQILGEAFDTPSHPGHFAAAHHIAALPDSSPLYVQWHASDHPLAIRRRLHCASTFDGFTNEDLMFYLGDFLAPKLTDESDRPLLEYAARRGGVVAWFAFAALVRLDHVDPHPVEPHPDEPHPIDGRPIDPELVDLAANADEAITRQQAWGFQARAGDASARDALIEAAQSAPHVVLRADALSHLRHLAHPPFELFFDALRNDREVYDLYYEPAATEAAVALQRRPGLDGERAWTALTEAALAARVDDISPTLTASIHSWFGGPPVTIRAVWNHAYARELAPSTGR